MCEFTGNIKKPALLFLFHNDLKRVFPYSVRERFIFGLKPLVCSICGAFLTNHQMRPIGRTTRSLCQNCFETYISTVINQFCFVCGNPLPASKIRQQYSENREIRHHIEDGECLYCWTLMHCATVGEPDVLTAIETKYFDENAACYPDESIQYQNIVKHQVPKTPYIPSHKGKPILFLE